MIPLADKVAGCGATAQIPCGLTEQPLGSFKAAHPRCQTRRYDVRPDPSSSGRLWAMSLRSAFSLAAAVVALGAPACSSSSGGSSPPPPAPTGVTVVFDATADLHTPDHFFDFPWPSDTRLTSTGTPDLAGLPNPTGSQVLAGLTTIAQQRAGLPMVPVAWFRFTADVAPHVATDTIAASPSSPILLLDVDPKSPMLGTLLPTIAETLTPDAYVPSSVLAVGVRPGIVLEPHTQYAFVVMTSANDATGKPLGVATALSQALSGGTDAVGKLFTVLPPALKKAGLDQTKVAAATVFTTGDVVNDLFQLSSKVLASNQVTIDGAKVDPMVLDTNPRFCELQATVTYPQYQVGYDKPPYDTGGLFQLDASGAPMKQGDLTVPVTITLPKQEMPAGGYPLVVYFHGTGGMSTAIADRGVWRPETSLSACPPAEVALLGNLTLETWNNVTGCNTPGQGPGYVMANWNVAMAASALPLNPQRWLAGQMSAFPEYIDINNVAATRDDFRQGVIEQRLFIAALSQLSIPPSVVSGCTGLALPNGESAYHFNTTPVLAQGQSMGAMYANMISAVEPHIKAVVPTGSGGYWSWFILQTQFIPNVKGELGLLLGIHVAFTHMHPAMHMVQMALEPVDPIVYMPRLGRNPLPGHPVRPVYEPHGQGDSYFPMAVQDAVAMAYGHKEAGQQIWNTMQQGLTLEGLQGIIPYPVTNDVSSESGSKRTGVVVQYLGDGVYDPHAIYSQLDAVKYQYGCFFHTFLQTGTATVPDPGSPVSFSAPCPQ